MNLWIILPALAGLTLVYILAPLAFLTFREWRHPWRLVCPRAGTVAQIKVDAVRAAVAAVLGRRVEIERCSLWPGRLNCRQECLTLPFTARQRMRRGEAPPVAQARAEIRIIIVPLDGTRGSEAVLPAVGELARAHGATVRLLRVVAPVTEVHGDDDRVVAYVDQESMRAETEARDYLTRAAEALTGIAVQAAVRFGHVVPQVVAEAEAAEADLIAMATQPRRGLRLLRRSVAGQLQQATTIPLLLVPYGERATAGPMPCATSTA